MQRETDGGDKQTTRRGECVHKTESVMLCCIVVLSCCYRRRRVWGYYGTAVRRRRRWCCRFCVLSEKTGAVRIGEIDRCRYRRRAQSSPPDLAVLPRLPERNYLLRPSYFDPYSTISPAPPLQPSIPYHRRPTDNHPLSNNHNNNNNCLLNGSISSLYDSGSLEFFLPFCGFALRCLALIFLLIFKNYPNVLMVF